MYKNLISIGYHYPMIIQLLNSKNIFLLGFNISTPKESQIYSMIYYSLLNLAYAHCSLLSTDSIVTCRWFYILKFVKNTIFLGQKCCVFPFTFKLLSPYIYYPFCT